MSTLAAAALDTQVDLLRWTRSEVGQRFANAMGEAFDRSNDNGGRVGTPTGRLFWDGQIIALDQGETFAVTEEIVDLLDSAASTLPEFELRQHDAPAPCGFVWLERPIIVLDDANHAPVVIKALAWLPAGLEHDDGTAEEDHGTVVLTWSDPADERDHLRNGWAEVMSVFRMQRPPLAFMGLTPHRWSDPVHAERRYNADVLRFVYTLWRFVQEPFIDGRAILPDRPAQKRAIRAGRPTAEVRVVRLRKRDQRRYDGEHLDDDEVLWSHRWLVKGHWRQQWYPSQERHAPKWISGYVKGPEHLPLLVKDTVFQVDR